MRFLIKHASLALVVFTCVCNSFASSERWSRQITHDLRSNDWIPINREVGASYEDDLTPAAQNSFQFFAEPNNNRFKLQQSHPAASSQGVNNFASSQGVNNFASSQGVNNFASSVPDKSTSGNFQYFNGNKQRTVQTFGGPIGNRPQAEALVQPPLAYQYMQEIQRGPHVHHYQSQPIPKNLQDPSHGQAHPLFQTQQNPLFGNINHSPSFESTQVPSFAPIPSHQNAQNDDQTQLLYVPFDSLYQNQQNDGAEGSNRGSHMLNTPVSASLINDFYSQNEVQEAPFRLTTTIRPAVAPTTITQPFDDASKPKSHQPPLSMFFAIDKLTGATESDVLLALKNRNANSIDVLDSVLSNAPNPSVFIGPSLMKAPKGYTKFELPYLSNLEGSRYERKIEQLPFFVAPLSYRTPPGFSKIPLPAPHVGSVVVNHVKPSPSEKPESRPSSGKFFPLPPTPTPHSSRFVYTPHESDQSLRTDFASPTLFPSSRNPFENQQRSVFTTPSPVQHSSKSAISTPITKVAYKEIEQKRNFGTPTHSPTTTRGQPSTPNFEYTRTSHRSTSRAPVKFVELEEHKTINEEYFGFAKEKKPSYTFNSGSNEEKITTKKPRTKVPNPDLLNFEHYKTTNPVLLPSTPGFDYSSTVSSIENIESFGQVNGGSEGNYFEYRSSPKPKSIESSPPRTNLKHEDAFPKSPYSVGDFNSFSVQPNPKTSNEEVSTTGESDYSLPSELPSISPQLPGWINSLMDDRWIQKNNSSEEVLTTQTASTTTTTTTARPSNRGTRRPVTTNTRASATESTVERRPTTRTQRRPQTSVTRNSPSSTESSGPLKRIPSRVSKVKYNATSDDQTKFRAKNRAPVKKEERNLEYQRDVLNQNYPSQRPAEILAATDEDSAPNDNTFTVPTPSVEVIPLGGFSAEDTGIQKHVYFNSPTESHILLTTTTTTTQKVPFNHNSQSLPGLNELRPKEELHPKPTHNLKSNFVFKSRNVDSFYSTPESVKKTSIPANHDETVSASTESTKIVTTEETIQTDQPILRKTNTLREHRRRLTTTDTPALTTDTTESTANRPQKRKESVVVVKKSRGRVRPSTTTTEQPETTRRSNLRSRTSLNRYSNREQSKELETNSNEEKKPRFRIRENTPRFRLETQESQWSSRFSQNSFYPANDSRTDFSKNPKFDDEQEIVTAGPDNDEETYLLTASASLGSKNTEDATSKSNKTESEKPLKDRATHEDDLGSSFEQFVQDVLENIEGESGSETKNEKKPHQTEKKANKRGVWKKIKVRPVDGFETAETQNIGKQLFNSIKNEEERANERKTQLIDENTTVSKAGNEVTTETPLDYTTPSEEIDEEASTTTTKPAFEIPLEFSSSIPATEEISTSEVDRITEKTEQSSKQVKTSTRKKISGEICYKGRCIKTEEK